MGSGEVNVVGTVSERRLEYDAFLPKVGGDSHSVELSVHRPAVVDAATRGAGSVAGDPAADEEVHRPAVHSRLSNESLAAVPLAFFLAAIGPPRQVGRALLAPVVPRNAPRKHQHRTHACDIRCTDSSGTHRQPRSLETDLPQGLVPHNLGLATS